MFILQLFMIYIDFAAIKFSFKKQVYIIFNINKIAFTKFKVKLLIHINSECLRYSYTRGGYGSLVFSALNNMIKVYLRISNKKF